MPANFHIPDLFKHLKLNITLIDCIKLHPEWFRDGVKIASVYGSFPDCIWNGGRTTFGKCSNEAIKFIIEQYNSRGVPLRFTFTNLLITEKHLGHPMSNQIMRMANNGFNEVIVVVPVLEKYIRENYPEYKITSSTCKQIEDMEALREELEKDYALVVLDYNWNGDYEKLEQIPHKEKCEILINACCTPNCRRRGEHYRSISQDTLDYDEHIKNPIRNTKPFKGCDFECQYMNGLMYDRLGYKTFITEEDLYDKYVPMGFSQFKIEGRNVNDIDVLESYVYYMTKPECRDKARLHLLKVLTNEISYFD